MTFYYATLCFLAAKTTVCLWGEHLIVVKCLGQEVSCSDCFCNTLSCLILLYTIVSFSDVTNAQIKLLLLITLCCYCFTSTINTMSDPGQVWLQRLFPPPCMTIEWMIYSMDWIIVNLSLKWIESIILQTILCNFCL